MAQNQTFSEVIAQLHPGAIVNANGEIAVIIDVLTSQFSDKVCLYVRFPRNVGNARPYDVLELSPQQTLGVEQWTPATRAQLQQRLASRRKWLEGEIEKLLEMTTNDPLFLVESLIEEAVTTD